MTLVAGMPAEWRALLIELDPRSRTQEVVPLPDELHGATALARAGRYTFFFGPNGGNKLLRWIPGAVPVTVGTHLAPLRGLDAGRFLAVGEQGFSVLRPSEIALE